jgi:hypothetical protein
MTKTKCHSLSDGQLNEFHTVIKNKQYDFHSKYNNINKLLIHYKKEDSKYNHASALSHSGELLPR